MERGDATGDDRFPRRALKAKHVDKQVELWRMLMPYSPQLAVRGAAIAESARVGGTEALVSGWMADPMLAALRQHEPLATTMRALLTRNANGILSSGLMQPPRIPTPRLDQIRIPDADPRRGEG